MTAETPHAAICQRIVPPHMLQSEPAAAGFQVARLTRHLVLDLSEGARRNGNALDWETLTVTAAKQGDGIVLTARAGLR